MSSDEESEGFNATVSYLFVVLLLLVVPLASCVTRKPSAGTAVELTPDDAMVDSGPQEQGGSGGTRAPPTVPEPWQKKPRGKPPVCGKKEYVINGACYRRAHPDDYSPPCEAPTVEWQGACFFAVRVDPRPDTSLQR